MLWYIADLTLYVICKSITGLTTCASYIIFGKPEDPLIKKIEEVLEKRGDELRKIYWQHRDEFKRGNWIVINKDGITSHLSKIEALVLILEYNKKNLDNKCLFVQVGDESSMSEL